MKVAMPVGVFPTPTETWIPAQMVHLISLGVDLAVFGAPAAPGSVHPIVEQNRLMDRVVFRRRSPRGRIRRVLQGPLVALTAPDVDRLAMLGCLNGFRFGWHLVASGALPLIGESILRRYRHHQPDLIHCHDALVGAAIAPLYELGALRAPLILTAHGPDLLEARHVQIAGGYKLLAAHTHTLTVGSMFMRNRAIGLGFDPARIVVIPQGTTTDDWPFRERTIAPGAPVTIVCVGRHTAFKGYEFAIDAFAIIRLRFPGSRLILIGNGPMHVQLKARAASLGLADYIDFPGILTRDRLVPVLDRAHIFLHPGIHTDDNQVEAQGVVLQEAQACGLPVVATDVGGIPESVARDRSALIVPSRDARALADALSRLLSNPSQWPEMGRAGRNLVKLRFEMSTVADRLFKLYQAVLAQSRG